ncbi:MAG: hypothetical protein IJU81_08965 [Bacteroidales bacterium]|nr:hypothetical protein [Bacteroidales bacterium]
MYKGNYNILSFYCDCDDRLALWAAARIMQEGAEEDTVRAGIGFEGLMAQGKAWVICRMHYEIHERPHCGENVMLTTWSRGTNGLFALRDSRIEGSDGRTLITSTTHWVIIDYNTRHACRINTILDNFDKHDMQATSIEKLDKMHPPLFDESNIVFSLTTRRAMIDHTMHVNNSEYLRWITDVINADGIVDYKAIDVDFVAETKCNEKVDIYKIQDGSTIWFQILNSRGVAIRAKITL